MRHTRFVLPLALFLGTVTLPLTATTLVGCKKADATGNTYSAKGVVKTITPDKKTAMIAHEDIPGYMSAMTMSFQAGSAGQLDGFAPGDKVTFSFTEVDHARTLSSIAKVP
jgi:Cu/Ag efflux protein CusF